MNFEKIICVLFFWPYSLIIICVWVAFFSNLVELQTYSCFLLDKNSTCFVRNPQVFRFYIKRFYHRWRSLYLWPLLPYHWYHTLEVLYAPSSLILARVTNAFSYISGHFYFWHGWSKAHAFLYARKSFWFHLSLTLQYALSNLFFLYDHFFNSDLVI